MWISILIFLLTICFQPKVISRLSTLLLVALPSYTNTAFCICHADLCTCLSTFSAMLFCWCPRWSPFRVWCLGPRTVSPSLKLISCGFPCSFSLWGSGSSSIRGGPKSVECDCVFYGNIHCSEPGDGVHGASPDAEVRPHWGLDEPAWVSVAKCGDGDEGFARALSPLFVLFFVLLLVLFFSLFLPCFCCSCCVFYVLMDWGLLRAPLLAINLL